ncbi:MAG: trypsin-like peptidase domain-containing protein, partial [Acidobacteriota bacterium]|nr:trypsin-like peptidase domain-containing protein [Acidobacteriota bacterium]
MRTARICVIALVFACATAMAETPEQIFKQVSPSVVVIHVSDAAGKPLALGSGVVIHPSTVITNCHVAQAGAGLLVNYRGKSFVATLRYADRDRDLCELSVPDLPAPPVALANTGSLQVGQSVYAIGAPEGLELTL